MEHYDLSKYSGKKFSEIKNGPVTDNSKRSIRVLSFILSSILFISGTSIAFEKGRKSSKEYSKNVSYENIDKLYSAVKNNPNLSENEKEIINNIDELFDDYYQYIDYDTACNQLSRFCVEYKEYGNNFINTAGQWNYHFHVMDLYTNDCKAVSLEDNPIATHELIHLISVDGSYFPDTLEEGIDSLIISEYYNFFDAYSKQRIITSMLCEIISPEIIMKSYLRKDYSLIEKELLKINPDRVQAYTLKSLLNQYQELYEKITSLYNIDLSEHEKNKADIYFEDEKVIVNSINKILCDYYSKKTNKLVSNSYYVNSYFFNNPILINFSDNRYSVIFSIYSTMLITSPYTLSEYGETYDYYKEYDVKTGYFNKDIDSREVIIGDTLIVDTEKNKAKKF